MRREEMSAGAIAASFDVSRPAISQHLAVLREAGLVEERRDGVRRLYKARPQGLVGLSEFFTDPDKMIQWMGRSARLEPRPGGEFHCDINGRDVASGEFVELDPPRRAVFTWGWEGDGSPAPPGSTTIEVLLEPDGEGTRLRLLHRDLPGEEVAEKHRRGRRRRRGRSLGDARERRRGSLTGPNERKRGSEHGEIALFNDPEGHEIGLMTQNG